MKPTRLAVVTLVLAVSPLVVLPSLSAGSPAQAAAALVLPEETRLAFTDERDHVQGVTISRATSGSITADTPGSLLPPETGSSNEPTHVGELSGRADLLTIISTADSPEGEVYISPDPDLIVRVTCDRGTETHPVLGPEGYVFYASDRDGDWDIYLANGPIEGTDCEGWDWVNLTDDLPGEQLWPTWSVERVDEETSRHSLVFSSSEDGRLPDLVQLRAQSSVPETVPMDSAAWAFEQLTESPAVAETQPALFPGRTLLAFTSTADRPDGSLRLMDTTDPTVVFDPWGTVPRVQSSEPVWGISPGGPPPMLAFTTRESDPHGDISIVYVTGAEPEFSGRSTPVAQPGLAETHPGFLDTFGAEDGVGILAYTARAQRNMMDPEVDHVLDADIGDVRRDGTDRRVRVDEVVDEIRADEAGPDYSPDGSRIAFSRSTVCTCGDSSPEREIWIANADGSGAVSLAGATRHVEGYVDRDPVWSPDGNWLAFVREQPTRSGFQHPVVMVVWVGDSAEHVYQVTPLDVTDPDGTTHSWHDTDPDWSPDGNSLVIRRKRVSEAPILLRPAPGWGEGSPGPARRGEYYATPDAELWVVPADESEDGVGVPVRYCPESGGVGTHGLMTHAAATCVTVPGRHPTWAPDGSALAFSYRGILAVAAIVAEPDSGFEVEDVAFLNASLDGETLPEAAAVLSQADDPTWSPDSSEIAFTGQPIGQPDQRGIYRINPDGTGLAVVTDGRGPESEPTYQRIFNADLRTTVSVTGSPAEPLGDLVATYTVTNDGPDPATAVELTPVLDPDAIVTASATTTTPVECRTDATGCTFPTIAVGETKTYVITFHHATAIITQTSASAVSETPDPVPANNTGLAPYEVANGVPLTPKADVGVTVTLDEPLGYVGGQRVATVTVRNRGPQTARAVSLQGTWLGGLVVATPAPVEAPDLPAPECLPAGDSCTLGDLAPGAVRSFRVALSTLTEMTGTITARVATTTLDRVARNNTATVLLEVVQPTIRLVPAVARPGQVVMAYGENMPPGSAVQLQWDAGLVIDQGPIIVADDGTARTSILLVRRDFLGTRILTASSDAGEFGAVTGDLLVTLRTMTAPEMIGRG